MQRVIAYLVEQGVEKDALQLGPHEQSTEGEYVKLDKLGNQKWRLDGYRVRRIIDLRNHEHLDLIEDIRRRFAAELRRTDVRAHPGTLRFAYSGSTSDVSRARSVVSASARSSPLTTPRGEFGDLGALQRRSCIKG